MDRLNRITLLLISALCIGCTDNGTLIEAAVNPQSVVPSSGTNINDTHTGEFWTATTLQPMPPLEYSANIRPVLANGGNATVSIVSFDLVHTVTWTPVIE